MGHTRETSAIQCRSAVNICALACLLSVVEAPVRGFNAGSTNGVDSAKHQLHPQSVSVTEWFSRYDQIRRDAEMTTGDKLQSMVLNAKKPEPENAALASRMLEKYTTALSQIKSLGSPPQTRELQKGYIKYFSSARQLFGDYLIAQKTVPFTNRALVPTKKTLEALDKTNKRLDAKLRSLYVIPKHKHS